MCMFNKPKQQAAPELPPEPAQAKQPDAAAVKTAAGRRTEDRVRSGTKTIITGGSGVTEFADTEKKTLLGQ
jgi:hypothetical protein